MPTYLKFNGKVIDEYSSDNYSRIEILDLGYEYAYQVVPVQLSEEENLMLEDVMERLAYRIKPEDLLDGCKLERALEKWGLNGKIIYAVKCEVAGYSWLEPLMADEKLEDIQCFKAESQIKVTHSDYGLMQTNIVPSSGEVDRIVKLLAYRGGSAVSIFRAKEDSVILPTGDRAALTFRSEISPTSSFTIRKFPRDPWTPTKMINTGMITSDAMAFLWLCIDAKLPVMIFGPMASGKTSLANSLAMLIRHDSSIALCQDAPEMKIPHENILNLFERRSRTASSSGEVTLEDLLTHALRRSVDYVTVNEVRGRREVYTFAQAVALGHGGITSIHAESVEAVFARLKGYGVEESLAENIRILVETGLFIGEFNGKRVRLRRVKGIYFQFNLKNYRPKYNVIFKYNSVEDRLEFNENNNYALKFIADKLYLDHASLNEDLNFRSKFLDYAAEAKIFSVNELFNMLKKFRRDPIKTIENLKSMFTSKPSMERRILILADSSEIKYCPRCGFQLTPKLTVCPRCGFKLYSKLEAEIGELNSNLR